MTDQSIIEKIRNLRAKAADAAATEAEAEQAAAMAARLLAKYDINECDLQQTDSSNRGTVGAYQTHKNSLHVTLVYCAIGIAELTETKAYKTGGRLNFVGTGPDVEMGLYLAEMIRGAADRAWKTYRINTMQGARSASDMNRRRRSFLMGFGVRLNERLKELAEERKASRGTGTDLVVVKDEIIKSVLEQAGIKLRAARARSSRVNSDSFGAGRAAGGQVNLNRPLKGGGAGSARIAY